MQPQVGGTTWSEVSSQIRASNVAPVHSVPSLPQIPKVTSLKVPQVAGVSTQVTSLLVPQIPQVGGVSTQVTSLLVPAIPQVQPKVTRVPLGQIAQLGVPNQVVAQDQVTPNVTYPVTLPTQPQQGP